MLIQQRQKMLAVNLAKQNIQKLALDKRNEQRLKLKKQVAERSLSKECDKTVVF